MGGAASAVGGKGGPQAPDFMGLAQQQAALGQQAINQQTAANRPDQNGPFGSTSWQQGQDGQWTQNVQLAGGLGDAAQNLMQQAGSQGTPMTGDQARDQAINAAWKQSTSRLDPMWAQREEGANTRLLNEGFTRGDAGFTNAQENLGRERTDAYQAALLDAIGQGTQAGAATFAQNQAAARLPYELMTQLQGLSQANQFNPAGASQPPDLLGAAGQQYGASVDQYNAQQAGLQGLLTGGAALGLAPYTGGASLGLLGGKGKK